MREREVRTARIDWTCGLALALLIGLFPAVGAADKVADVENRGAKLVFWPLVEEFDSIILTVTGPCNYEYRERIEPGGAGVFRLSRETIDASYTYSLVTIPKVEGDILEILQKARDLNDNTEVDALCREGAMPGAPLTQSEGFVIDRGQIVYDPFKQEDIGGPPNSSTEFGGFGEIPLKDFLINDDLIVDGSACIGFDCVNGESFGFDTIKVKENNLRIKFDDTSVAASFPRNDWQLTANDSANGGASKFSIDDISGGRTPFTVEANARSHSLYVDDGGRIGNRTSTPSTEIHTIDGDTPTLRLQQDGSSGFTPQTWDVAGNETSFFIRDVTNGSQLPLRIRPGAPTSSIDISAAGNVGIGTASPDAALDVENTDGGQDIKITSNNNNARVQFSATQGAWLAGLTTPSDEFTILDLDSGVTQLVLTSAGDLTVLGNLVTGGGGTCDPGPCDGTFIDYELESISEHAEYMWENQHLWGVGPTPDGAPLNLSKKTTGILHELEKAHIYIEQLHQRLETKDAVLEDIQARLSELEQGLK